MMATFGVVDSVLVRIAGSELTLMWHLLRAGRYPEQLMCVHSLSSDSIRKKVVLPGYTQEQTRVHTCFRSHNR